jgi:hypothetical protein
VFPLLHIAFRSRAFLQEFSAECGEPPAGDALPALRAGYPASATVDAPAALAALALSKKQKAAPSTVIAPK